MNYSWLLLVHGATRWLVLIVGILALLRAWQGFRRAEWTRVDEILNIGFISMLDIQLLLGFALYGISPLRTAAYAAPGQAMSSEMGFFAFLHPALMVAAIVVAHVGRALSKRSETPVLKQERLWKFYLAALILIAMAVPWWRPFSRF